VISYFPLAVSEVAFVIREAGRAAAEFSPPLSEATTSSAVISWPIVELNGPGAAR